MKLKRLLSLVAMIFALGGGSLWAQYTTGSTVAAGDYFLYNIAAQKFLTNGMDWGTHATVDNAGRVITLAALPDGKYSIYTKNYSSDDAKGYMTTNGYVDTGSNDANWIFTPVSVDGYTNVYTIKNSDTQYLYYDVADSRVQVGNATGTNADYWIIVPKSVRDAAGEVTYLLQNTDFNRPWERPIWAGAIKDNKADGVGGSESNRNQERYNMTFDVNQTVSGVTNGIYRFTCQGFYRNGTTNDQYAMMYINSTTYPLKNIHADGQAASGNGFSKENGGVYVPNSQADASNVFDAGYYQNEMAAIVTNGTLKLGFKKDVEKASDWSLFDNIKLYNKLIPGSNVTSLITNPSFETGNGDGWEFNSANDTGVKENSNNTYKTEGVNGYYLFNTWGGTTEKYIQQTVSGLPEGVYELKALFASDNGLNMKLYANDDFSEVTTTGKGQFVECSVTTKIAEGGNLKIKATSTDWYKVDNFRLAYVGNYVEHYATPLPAEATTANDWYAYTINVDGDYKITSSVNATIKYTQNGSQERGQVTTSVNCVASEPQMLSLTAGTIYVSPSVAATITIEANNNVYYVGEATCDMAYAQPGQTVTVNYAEAMTNDGTAPFAKKGNPNVTVNGTAVQNINVTGTSFTFTMPEVAANGTYTLNIPADAFGYVKGNTYNDAQNITINTPAVYDGTYFLKVSDGRYLSRGDNYNTCAIVDNYGVAARVATNSSNVTTFTFVDSNKMLFDADNGTVYTDNTNYPNWTVAAADGGFNIINANNRKTLNNPLAIEENTDASYKYDRIVTKSGLTAAVFTFEAPADHIAQMASVKDAQAAGVASELSIGGVTTKAGLDTYVSENLYEVPVTITGANGELYQATGDITETVEGLQNGLYKVEVDAFARIAFNPNKMDDETRGMMMPNTTLYANNQEVQLYSPYEQASPSTNKWSDVTPADVALNGNYIPNNTTSADAAFNAGNYHNEIYVNVTNGTLKFGIYKANKCGNGDWLYYNNFKVTQYVSESIQVDNNVMSVYGSFSIDDVNTALSENDNIYVLDVTDATALSGVSVNVTKNPNMLIYAKTAGQVNNDKNVVVGTTCGNLVLTDGHPFKAHKAFTASSASYTGGAVASGVDPEGISVSFGTLMLPFTATGNAYTLTASPMSEYSVATPVTTIEANKPYIVTSAETYEANDVEIAATTAATYTNGDLTGVYTATPAPENSYVLQKHGDVVAFYMNAGANPTVNPFHAYIAASEAGANTMRVVFEDADETGIETLQTAGSSTKNGVYDLTGRKMHGLTKSGLYIVNGKKVVIK